MMKPLPMKTLEARTERVIKRILHDTVRDVATIDDFDFAVSRIGTAGYDQMHAAVITNYHSGYVAAGEHIRHALRVAAVGEHEDPLVARYTTQLLYGLERVADNQRSEIQAALRTLYEKGYTHSQITESVSRKFFAGDDVAASRFARTATNSIYNASHLDRYEQSGVVDGVQYSAHIDNRTSDICRVLDGTIWALDSSDIQVPPNHFNCLVAGTQIMTINGMQDIESIKIFDMVLTHNNRYMHVRDTMNRVPDELVEIKTANRSIQITPNHPVLVERNGNQVWVAAGELTAGDNIIVLE